MIEFGSIKACSQMQYVDRVDALRASQIHCNEFENIYMEKHTNDIVRFLTNNPKPVDCYVENNIICINLLRGIADDEIRTRGFRRAVIKLVPVDSTNDTYVVSMKCGFNVKINTEYITRIFTVLPSYESVGTMLLDVAYNQGWRPSCNTSISTYGVFDDEDRDCVSKAYYCVFRRLGALELFIT